MKKSKIIIASALLTVTMCSFGLAACDKLVEETDVTAPVIMVEGLNEYLINYGSTFTLPKITVQDDVDENVKWSLTVKNGDAVAEVDENGSFVADKSGAYIATVTAEDAAGNKTDKQIVINVRNATEINTFDAENRLDGVTAKGVAEISINTDTEYVRYGTGSLKLEVQKHVSTSWPGIIVKNLPISDISQYYSISFWIYNDGVNDIDIFLHRNEVNVKAKFNIPSKVWKKIEIAARDYDDVFQFMDGKGAEPEVGVCDDLKCFTFHFANPANTPTFNVYVDDIRVNTQKIDDTLDISTKITHPVVGAEYMLPTATVQYGGETIDADVTYGLFDKDYNKLEIIDGKYTFEESGEYTLIINADYNGFKGANSYKLICSATRAENEIAFFEDESNLSFFKSEHFAISLNTDEKHSDNGSTASMKLHSCLSKWPYLTISGVPYADLEGVAYIYMYVKTDYNFNGTEIAYLGIRDGEKGKVLKRISLTNEWQCFALTKGQLASLGVTTLDGLQMSVELYDKTNPQNEGGWCPVAFNTYIDNFTVCKEQEPTKKVDGVVLDFANYRDLDDIESNWLSYNFADLSKTVNQLGSLKLNADAKWPWFKFGDSFDKFSLDGVQNLVMEIYVPKLASGYVRIGPNDSNYQKITAEESGDWISIYFPVSALLTAGNTLKGQEFNVARNDGSTWVNVEDLYIGKIWLDYEGKPVEKHTFTNAETADDLFIFTVTNTLYEVSLNLDKTFVKDGEKSIKLSAVPRWPQYYFSQEFIDFLKEKNYVKFSFDVYVDESGSETEISAYEGCISSYSSIQDEWFTVTLDVVNISTSTYLQFNKNATKNLDAYVDNIKYYTQKDLVSETFGSIESDYDLGIFKTGHTLAMNSDKAFVKEGSKSIKFTATPQWPGFYFAKEFIDYLNTEGYTSISLDLYIDNANSETECTRMEGYKLIYQSDLTVNEWFTITLNVSELAENKYFQFNKSAAKPLSVYIDNMKYIK